MRRIPFGSLNRYMTRSQTVKRIQRRGLTRIICLIRELKKIGEEATEVVIAAKNPNPEEVKYEIADFLYHAMVLMVEKGLTWEDIVKELADR